MSTNVTKPSTEETWQERIERESKEFRDKYLQSFFVDNERKRHSIFCC